MLQDLCYRETCPSPQRSPQERLDVGCHTGAITRMLRRAFPAMGIHGYDIGQEYVDRSRALTPSPRCTFMLGAITSAHLFEDDLGQVPRAEAITLIAQFCHVKKRSRSDWRGSHTMVKGDLPADTV